jgi:hypothetical protein
MPSSIEERILDLIESKLEAITTGGGYEQTVGTVWRATQSPPPMESTPPSLQIRSEIVRSESLLRGADEKILEVTVICTAAQESDDEKLGDLMADVQKVVGANERWNDGSVNLARRTWMGDSGRHETETGESPGTGYVTFFVLFRVSSTSAYTLAEI